ncbi:hypothetical protein [Chryseobacterium sp. FH1]|uniref:hypothetical protein n=1 Tax=Chryseobacterium sp. FH1 TaxID=1233951 RepID=UPI0004E2B587|nr:hypothetical protein [Chryseobacterium sp. FH1]KFC19387.1 hypothetical protein IO90_08800 [Chryseobacterium sp. FH1]
MKNSSIFFTEISGKYVLPVPRTGFTINDENSEFSEDILVEWTYPYNIYQTDLIKRIFPDYLNPNAKKRKEDKGYINVDGVVSPCIIKFLGGQLKELKVQFEFGVGVLGIMDKNLSEIDFGTLETDGLYDHIDANIGKIYPEIDICFPRIINSKYFEGFLNENDLYGGRFIFNDSNIYDGESANRILRNEFAEKGQVIFNQIKPIPYLLFIIKRAFLNEDLIVKGDILEDEYVQQICVDQNNIADSKSNYDSKKMPLKNNGVDIINYEKKEEFEIIGRYVLSAEIFNIVPDEAEVKIELFDKTNNVLLFNFYRKGKEYVGETAPESTIVTYNTETFESPIIVEYKVWFNNVTYYINDPGNTYDVYLNPVGKSFFQLPVNLELNKYMPEATFKEIFNMVLKLRNYVVTITSKNEVFINYNLNEPPTDYLNLEFSEQINPEILANDRSDFVLTYSAPEELGFSDYLVKNKTLEEVQKGDFPKASLIELNAYPLKNLTGIGYVGNLKLEEPESEVKGIALFRYSGLQDFGYNNGISIENMMQSVYDRIDNYIENRLNCDLMKWSFLTKRRLSNLNSQMPIYAYGCFHKVKTIIKTFYEDNLTKYDIETENRY